MLLLSMTACRGARRGDRARGISPAAQCAAVGFADHRDRVSSCIQNGGQLLFAADPKFFPSLVTSRETPRTGALAGVEHSLIVLGTA